MRTKEKYTCRAVALHEQRVESLSSMYGELTIMIKEMMPLTKGG